MTSRAQEILEKLKLFFKIQPDSMYLPLVLELEQELSKSPDVRKDSETLEYIKENPTILNLLQVDDDSLIYTHSMNLSDTSFESIINKIKTYLEE